MHYCSQCGTKNSPETKFCSNCGARLAPVSGLVCPMCSTPNPVETVFCNNCGARLVPMIAGADRVEAPPPIKGLSLPAKSAPVEPAPREEESQAWLDDLRPAAPVEPKPRAAESQAWLDNLRAAVPVEPASREEESPEPLANLRPAAPEPTPRAEESQEWLADLRPAAPAPAPREEELQERLSELRLAAPELASSDSAEDLPDWLRDAAPAREIETAATDEPTWLRDLRQKAGDAPPAPTPAPAADAEWLSALPEKIADTSEPPAKTEAAQDWLADLRRSAANETPPEAVAETETDEPSWIARLHDAAPPQAAHAENESAALPDARAMDLAPRDAPAKEILPDWLQDLESQQAAPIASAAEPEILKPLTPATPRVFAGLPTEETPDSGVPDWLRMAMPTEPAPIAPAAPVEIPTWVAQLKPAEFAPEVSTEPAETRGPFAGLTGILPLAAAIAQPHEVAARAARANGARGAQIFAAILAAPAPSETLAPGKPRRARTMRPLIYFLLALAVSVPFFLPANLATAGLRISGTAAAEFYDALRALPENSNVLLSFDYEPSHAGEMDLLANVVARQLMQRRAKIIAVSALPTGAPIAQRILVSAATANNNYPDYVIAGYIAGQEAGLAQFAANGLPAALRQSPLAAKITGPRDFAMIIELAGSDDALKMWMEQVQPRVDVRIMAATSAAAEPKARVYKDAKQLAALVSGLLGAAQYEVLSNQPGQAVLRVNGQSAAMLVLVLVVVVGNVAGLIAWVRRRNSKF